MQRRVLILTDSIAPPAYAPRVVNLCSYLSGQGWKCSVFSDCEKGVLPYKTNYGEWFHTAYYQHKFYHLRYLADKIFAARERQFQEYIETTINVAEYDAFFCSTYYFFPLQTTYRLATKYNKPFVVDLRDIAEQWGDMPHGERSIFHLQRLNKWIYRLFIRRNLRERNQVLEKADHVITISPWHRDWLSRFNASTHLIYNGFDADEFYPKDVKCDKFIISYSGKIYDLSFRDPRLLFAALQQLFGEGKIPQDDIDLRFHIDKESIFPLQQLVAQYGLTDICHISGYIPKDQLLALMHRSSIQLVLTCLSTPNGAHGIMGTKFYEALGTEKPVLCVRSDEECLAQVIEQTNAGLAGTEIQQVADFILEKYHEWKKNGFTRQKVRNKEQFTRQYQSQKIQEVIETITRRSRDISETISIIVPVYNAAKYLPACIESLLAQTISDLQIILIDDESTDNSLAIAQQYSKQDKRIEIHQQSHAGQSVARNIGLKHAKGKFIAFVDADDMLERDWCEQHLKAIQNVDYVQSGYKRRQGEKIIYRKLPTTRYRFTNPGMRLFRRQAIKNIEFPEGYIYEDVLFSVDLWIKNPKCRCINYTGYIYTLNPNSTTSQPHPEARAKLFHALHDKKRRATLRGKLIILYTLIRLRAHYLRYETFSAFCH